MLQCSAHGEGGERQEIRKLVRIKILLKKRDADLLGNTRRKAFLTLTKLNGSIYKFPNVLEPNGTSLGIKPEGKT